MLSLVLVTAAWGSSGDEVVGADGTAGGTTGVATESETTGSIDRDADFDVAWYYGHASLDPHRSFTGDEAWIRPLYDRLLAVVTNADGAPELIPQLATSFEVAPDGLTTRFELRDDVTFHDGTRFDADVVKANLERAQGPESNWSSYLEAIEDVEVVDDYTVEFHLSRPDPTVVWSMALTGAAFMISPSKFDTNLDAEPAGSGPFTLVSAQKDEQVVYERWDGGHWDPDAALVQRLIIHTVYDGNARLNGLRAGTYDAAFLNPPQEQEKDSLAAEGFNIAPLDTGTIGVLLNSDRPPFDDVRVRQAVSLALDRDQIVEALLPTTSPRYQAFFRGQMGFDESLEVGPFDPEAARELLREAGAEGANIQMVQAVNVTPHDQLAVVVQQALQEVGLNVELLPMSGTEARLSFRDGRGEALVLPIAGGAHPALTLQNAYLGGDNPATPPADLVEMAERAAGLPFGSDEQERAYQEISSYLIENPIHVPFVGLPNAVASQPNVVGTEYLNISSGGMEVRWVGKTTGS